jgi:isoleucyl-tRNA synthetase
VNLVQPVAHRLLLSSSFLQGLLSAIAPLVPHMAEDAWLNLPQPSRAAASSSSSNGSGSSSSGAESVFLAGWAAPEQQWGGLSQQELGHWAALPAVREAFTKTMEAARASKAIGSTQEAAVALHVSDPRMAAWLAGLNAAGNAADELRYLLITSEVELVGSAEEAAAGALASSSVDTGDDVAGVVTVGVRRAAGSKCARCWMYSTQVRGHGCWSNLFPLLCAGRLEGLVVLAVCCKQLLQQQYLMLIARCFCWSWYRRCAQVAVQRGSLHLVFGVKLGQQLHVAVTM